MDLQESQPYNRQEGTNVVDLLQNLPLAHSFTSRMGFWKVGEKHADKEDGVIDSKGGRRLTRMDFCLGDR